MSELEQQSMNAEVTEGSSLRTSLMQALVMLPLAATLLGAGLGTSASAEGRPSPPGPSADLAAIEACVSRNLPDAAGVIDFHVEAVDRSDVITTSRAEIRWRKDDASLSQVVLRVSEPAETAGTALLIVDRASDQPEFYLSLPDLPKVKRVRSKRLRGPVLGTDFSFEDLERLQDPVDATAVELVGVSDVSGRPSWLLETLDDGSKGSEYARVLTHVDQEFCLPIQINLYGEDDRLRKQLRAPVSEIRLVGDAMLPYVFVMEDLRRDTQTTIRIQDFQASSDLPAAEFTKSALKSDGLSGGSENEGEPPAAMSH